MLPSPDKLNDFKLGKFVLSNLAAKRAKQIEDGGTILVNIASTHPLTIALAEIAAGKVTPKMPEGVIATDGPEFDFESISGDTGLLLPSLEDAEIDPDEDLGDDHDDEHDGDEDSGHPSSENEDDDETASIADLVGEEGSSDSEESEMSLSDLQMKEENPDDEQESGN